MIRRVSGRLTAVVVLATLVGSGLLSSTPSLRPVVGERVINLSSQASALASGTARAVDTGITTEMVGFDWQGAVRGTVAVRALGPGGWSGWTTIDGDPSEGPDVNSKEWRAHTSAGPLWVGHGVHRLEFRILQGQLPGLRLHAIHSEAASTTSALPAASAAVAQPGIITRPQWAADESWRSFAPGCTAAPSYASNVNFLVIHHTVTSNSYGPGDSAAIVRAIYFFHTHTNLWCDIGYNFLVDQFGQIFEGRAGGMPYAVIGAHAGGFNTGSSGIALMGTFDTVAPSAAMWNSLVNLATWKSTYHNINPQGSVNVVTGDFPAARWPPGTPVTLPTIVGHRDVDQTDCPGSVMYAMLPQLRAAVAHNIAVLGPQVDDARLVCNWTGSGVATPAIFRSGIWYIRLSNTPGPPDLVIGFGNPGDRAVCGDWTGKGFDSVGIVRNGVWYLKNSNTTGVADIAFGYGNPSDTPVVGRWAGTHDGPGVVRGNAWYLRTALTTGVADLAFTYGNAGDAPVIGDWNGDGRDTPGVERGGIWYLRNSASSGIADIALGYGDWGDIPVAGRWTPGRGDTPGVIRGGVWYLRNSTTTGAADIAMLY